MIQASFKTSFLKKVAMNLAKEPPGKWLVDRKPHLNDVHQFGPVSKTSCPYVLSVVPRHPLSLLAFLCFAGIFIEPTKS